MAPLAEFYKRYRPSCQVIHIHRDDWQCIKQAADAARIHGFVIDDNGKITFQGFELQPVDMGIPHP